MTFYVGNITKSNFPNYLLKQRTLDQTFSFNKCLSHTQITKTNTLLHTGHYLTGHDVWALPSKYVNFWNLDPLQK